MTKILHIEARKKFDNDEINLKPLDNLNGKTISIAATVQYLDLIPKIKDYLKSKGKEVILQKGQKHKAQVLGCNSKAFDKTADTLLLLADGKFHAINNAIQLQKPIIIYNTKNLEEITEEDIESENKKTKTKQSKFLLAEKVGIIVSTKQGQKHAQINIIKKKIENQNKKAYIFEANNINTNELENFPQIKIWINTACSGLARDHKDIINLSDILEFLG
ncbi:MAG: diphthamide synthesis protein [archaeon]